MEHWFDDLARSAARESPSRREVLGRLGAGLAAAVLTSLFPISTSAKGKRKGSESTQKDNANEQRAAAVKQQATPTSQSGAGASKQQGASGQQKDAARQSKPRSSCPPGETLCKNKCVDTYVDVNYCGSCTNDCLLGGSAVVRAGGFIRCDGGQCTCAEEPGSPAVTYCPGVGCVDPQTSRLRCGGCDRPPCPRGQECLNGMCVECRPPLVTCRGADGCIDFRTNRDHCNGCFKGCLPAMSCVNFQCKCPPGQQACRGQCVDTQADRENCGRCGRKCDRILPDSECIGGACVCVGGKFPCQGKCSDPASDFKHCGGCPGVDCTLRNTNFPVGCHNGQCDCLDPSRPTFCPGVGCVDTRTEPRACGPTCTACPRGRTCVNGQCAPCDADSEFLCGPTCCPNGAACRQHVCICLDGQELCGNRCVARCTPPKVLNPGTCQCECAAITCSPPRTQLNPTTCQCECPSGTTPCGTTNCCQSTQTCETATGQCQGCPQGLILCSDRCVDTQTDSSNCGFCGNACGGGRSCVNGQCGGDISCDPLNAQCPPVYDGCIAPGRCCSCCPRVHGLFNCGRDDICICPPPP